MYSTRDQCAAVLLLVFIQVSVSTCSTNTKVDTNALTDNEILASYMRLPWTDGLDRLVHSAESPERKKVRDFVRGIESGEAWALQLLDSLPEDQPQIQETDLRDSSNCTVADGNIDVDNQDERCIVAPGTIYKCTTTDVNSYYSDVSKSGSGPSTLHNNRKDRIVDNKDFTTAEILVIVFFLSLAVILLGCTVCDFVKRNKLGESSATINTMVKFSLYTNAIALLDTKSTAEAMPAIHGIKCLCFFSVMFGHRYMAIAVLLKHKVKLLDIFKVKNTLSGVYLMLAPFAVNTFCVIGGFLTAYVFLKLKKSGKKFNVLTMYLNRYIRLTPCIAVILLIVSVLLHRCGSGPMWEFVVTYVIGPCRGYWWANLLYIQNMMGTEGICLGYTWYLSVDMQLFLLSPLILYPLHRYPKFGLGLLSFFMVVAIVVPAVILAANDYTTVFLRFDRDIADQSRNFGNFYISTYNWAFPYLLGILLGYDVVTNRRRLTKVNVAINWITAALIVLFCAWLNHRAYNSAFTDNLNVRIASAALLNSSWSIATAWLIYACTQGYGGWVTKFLSLPIFVPLGRLSYCIYLVHMAVQGISIASPESTATFLNSDSFTGICSNLAWSIVVAFVFNLFVESPTIVLTKILFANYKHQPKSACQIKERKKTR